MEHHAEWVNTPTMLYQTLLGMLNRSANEHYDFPKNPKALSDSLKNLIPVLHEEGIEVILGKRTAKQRQITLRKAIPSNDADDARDATLDPPNPLGS
ncbi:hypothetical protein D3C86_1728380 [compost metagenome]